MNLHNGPLNSFKGGSCSANVAHNYVLVKKIDYYSALATGNECSTKINYSYFPNLMFWSENKKIIFGKALYISPGRNQPHELKSMMHSNILFAQNNPSLFNEVQSPIIDPLTSKPLTNYKP